jgi:hypothetical protein
MLKLTIGYSSQVPDLSHPADRRRLVYWAKERGHTITTNLEAKVDLYVLSGRANFGYVEKLQKKAPVIIDLIDGYLVNEKASIDFLRGFGKVVSRQISGQPRRYSTILSEAISLSNATICATVEQQEPISKLTKNSHVILDFHEEFPFLSFNDSRHFPKGLLWEGQPFTVDGLTQLEPLLIDMSQDLGFGLRIVTDLESPRYLGRYGSKDTLDRLGNLPNSLSNHLVINPWSISNVVEEASKSCISILPLKPSNPLNSLKPENRLLIMWRLGLPCITSPTFAYNRVMKEADVNGVCSTFEEWKTKVHELAINVDARREMVEKGQNYIRQNHDLNKTLHQWDEAIGSVL